jgi:hypothetical protein
MFHVVSFEEDVTMADPHSLKPRGCVEGCVTFNPEKKKEKFKSNSFVSSSSATNRRGRCNFVECLRTVGRIIKNRMRLHQRLKRLAEMKENEMAIFMEGSETFLGKRVS